MSDSYDNRGPVSQGGFLTDLVTVLQTIAKNGGLVLQTLQAISAKFPNWVAVPTTASSPGTPGQVAYDATHFYICVQTNVWVRATLSTF